MLDLDKGLVLHHPQLGVPIGTQPWRPHTDHVAIGDVGESFIELRRLFESS